MKDKALLKELLEAETEADVLAALTKRKLLTDTSRWVPLGNMPNNQSIVHAQQSSPAAALVEKITNGVDAILLKECRAEGKDPRSAAAPQNMQLAVDRYFRDLASKQAHDIRQIAEESLVLYATGSRERPCLSLFDDGEGQLPQHFPTTFCSLVYGSNSGGYKGSVPFVQGRFNMGGSGVLPFCGDGRKLQLIVSRAPDSVVSTRHEWGFTLFCFFPSPHNPEWRYLVGPDGATLTAGEGQLGLVPKTGAMSGELCPPRERKVASGTLIKMYEYKAPRSNVCGELFRKLEEYLPQPPLPLRIVECRSEYQANVMGVNVWDRLSAWGKNKLEAGFEDGAGIQINLSTGEVVPAEVRVFKQAAAGSGRTDQPQTGMYALINGQSHAKRGAEFFRTKAVDKEHIASSILLTLDCTALGQTSRNSLFMSNRETFRDDVLLAELLDKVRKELKDHPGLQALNLERYEEKIANAVSDDDGIKALEDLLSTDPELAKLFGSAMPGSVAAKTLNQNPGSNVTGPQQQFAGVDFPTYFERADGSKSAESKVPRGGSVRVSFNTDVKNNYFTRSKLHATCSFTGGLQPSFRLFNGRLTFTLQAAKSEQEGTASTTTVIITDPKGSGPFTLTIESEVVAPAVPSQHLPPQNPPKVQPAPSRPNIIEVNRGADSPPLSVDRDPTNNRLQIAVNKESRLLTEAKSLRPKEEEPAVEFVFKYGLALIAMGLIESMKKTPEWTNDEAQCRMDIAESVSGVARVIVPLCLTLPQKLPKVA